MREIHFRAWQQVTKTMFYNIEKGTGAPHGNPPFADYLENANMIVMQFTGLLDRTGKEVYEGDIVENHIHDFNLIVKWCDGKGANLGNQVGWWLDDGYYQVEFEAYQGLQDDHEYANVSVLGNIYEHPELLQDVGSFGYDPLTGEQKQEDDNT